MIYEYPEEFVVPVKYVDDFMAKPAHRAWEVKYIKVDDLSFSDKEMQDKPFETNAKNFLKFDKDLSEEPYEGDMFKESLGYENANNILGDIDNEYANSETLR